MKKIIKFRIVLIICALIFVGLSAKSDYAVMQNNGLDECERIISQCQRRIDAKKSVIKKLESNYLKNPSPGLEKAIQIQIAQLKVLRIECVDDINEACQ